MKNPRLTVEVKVNVSAAGCLWALVVLVSLFI